MTPPPLRIVLLSDFETRNLGLALQSLGGDGVNVVSGLYGQVAQHLLDGGDPLWAEPTDAVVVWTTPAHASPAFQAAVSGHAWRPDELDRDVEAHVELLARAASRAGMVLIPTWVVDSSARNRGLVSTRSGSGVHHALTRMNLRLMEAAEPRTGLFVLPAERWLFAAGAGAFSWKHWYLAKCPFGLEVMKAAASDVLGAVASLRGAAKKLLIVDLDDTLWGGILGEEGVEGLRLGGHDAVGEAFVDFQRAIAALARTGTLLAIASKNDEALALEAIETHPEMVLRRKDFAAHRINWDDKAGNVASITEELSLGLDAVVFIDDSPAERDRVRSALPEVTVPDWPADKLLYAQTLRALRHFDTPSISAEDRERAGQYDAERSRRGLLDRVGSVEEWVRSLEVSVHVAALDAASLPRAAQLLNKTNQMNLSTRRMGASELLAWAESPGHTLLTVRAADRLGDYGLVGLLGLRQDDSATEVVDFVLSCRAMGRGIEAAMLRVARELSRREGKPRLVARYRKSDRNAACLKTLRELAPALDGETSTFIWETAAPPAAFGGVRITGVVSSG